MYLSLLTPGDLTEEFMLIQIVVSHVFYGGLLNVIISHHYIIVFCLKIENKLFTKLKEF